jgi:hypothetical protein
MTSIKINHGGSHPKVFLIFDAAKLAFKHYYRDRHPSNPYSPDTEWHEAYNVAFLHAADINAAWINVMLLCFSHEDIFSLTGIVVGAEPEQLVPA